MRRIPFDGEKDAVIGGTNQAAGVITVARTDVLMVCQHLDSPFSWRNPAKSQALSVKKLRSNQANVIYLTIRHPLKNPFCFPLSPRNGLLQSRNMNANSTEIEQSPAQEFSDAADNKQSQEQVGIERTFALEKREEENQGRSPVRDHAQPKQWARGEDLGGGQAFRAHARELRKVEDIGKQAGQNAAEAPVHETGHLSGGKGFPAKEQQA